MRKVIVAFIATIVVASLMPTTAAASAPAPPTVTAITSCTGGMAGGYPCKNVDLWSNLPLANMGGGSGSGGWGWHDSTTGKEYAVVARTTGTSFVDVTVPDSPLYLGNLPSATGTSSWRELWVHNNTVYIVSDSNGSHGMQVFDLTRLRGVTTPQTFTADARDTSFTSAHTININPATGFAYVNGSNTCSGGPRMFNLANRLAPAFAGCVSGDGYSHDSQAVTYNGPDTAHQGKEILVGYNENTVTIFDVSNKSAPVMLSRKTYAGSGYTHQGWFTEDHRYLLVDDETDETSFGHNTKTYVWDAADLDNPVLVGSFLGPTTASDHNQYVKGNHVYQANYRAGLRIINLTNIASPSSMTEDAYFDVDPTSNANGFAGAWTNYPYLPSGNVLIFSIQRGLFVVKPNLGAPPANDFSISVSPTSGAVNPGASLSATVNTAVVTGSAETVDLSASGAPAGVTVSFNPTSVTAGGSSTASFAAATSTTPGTYSITLTGTAPSATRSTTFALTVNGPPGCSGTNSADVQIPDLSTVESSIVVSGCTGNASATSTVEVHIVHTYIGDLVVSLVAPDGTAYTLHNRAGGSADNINQTYTVNLSSEAANGTWRLRVQDAASADVGYIDSWTLSLGGGGTPPCSGTNATDVTIPDLSTVTSTIAISGCSGNASATSTVEVHIVHTYIGDLVVSLVAPDGTAYTLHNRAGGSADNINQTYTVNLSSEVRNGTWTLRVQDAAAQDTGRIDSWTLTL